MIIEFDHLSKRYGKSVKSALDDINYASDNTKPLGIVGSNGAGKSTLFLLANGLARPTGGSVYLYGKSVWKDKQINRKTGLFTDKLVLYPVLTVKEIIRYFMGIYGIPQKEYKDRIGMFNIRDFENSKIEDLSTGMLKKVMLLISMLNLPGILFLDEPFSGLDMDTKNELSDIIKDLYQEHNIKIIISSHDLFETQLLIQDVLIMEEGKIIESGNFNELINKYTKARKLNIVCEDDPEIINAFGRFIQKREYGHIILSMGMKEIKMLFYNRLLIFANVLLPILIIAINLIYSASASVEINIGYFGTDGPAAGIKSMMSNYSNAVTIHFFSFRDEQSALDAFNNNEVSCVIHSVGEGSFDIYYNSGEQKSEIAYQYFVTALRDINVQNYSSEMIHAIMDAQTYVVGNTIALTRESSAGLNNYVWTGFIWIFVYSNLSLAITQMQQERATKTFLYLIKAGTRLDYLFLSKAIAGAIHFVIILTSFIVAASCLKLLDYHFRIQQIALWLMVFICIFSIGHLLGSVIKNTSLLVMIQMLTVLPLMLVNALQTSMFDAFLKRNPVYCGMNIAKNAMLGQNPSASDCFICISTIIICYAAAGIFLSKQEPIKICKLQ